MLLKCFHVSLHVTIEAQTKIDHFRRGMERNALNVEVLLRYLTDPLRCKYLRARVRSAVPLSEG